MEDRIRALETELNTLKTTLNTSKWWLGILGAFLIGSLGYTNFFSITNAVNDKFAKEGGQGIIEKLTSSEKSASESSATLKAAADRIGEFEPLQMYKCPVNPNTPGAQWVSIGCIGQISAENSCINRWWSGGYQQQPYPCEAITLFRKK